MANASAITVRTEPIGSIQRPVDLLERVAKGDSEDPELDRLYEEAILYTIERFEAAGSPVVTDSEQRRYHNFATYYVHGLPNTVPNGFKILFSQMATPVASCGSHVALAVTCGTPTVTSMPRCATRLNHG